jgi:flagellin-specific chaperone FliS
VAVSVPIAQLHAYRRQQVEAASPGQLVLMAFEQGVAACRRGLRGRAQRVVHELIAALDFEQAETAGGMLALYDWILRLLREGRTAEAERLLDELREAWARALRAQEEARRTAGG